MLFLIKIKGSIIGKSCHYYCTPFLSGLDFKSKYVANTLFLHLVFFNEFHYHVWVIMSNKIGDRKISRKCCCSWVECDS